jgi:hypothetical protein
MADKGLKSGSIVVLGDWTGDKFSHYRLLILHHTHSALMAATDLPVSMAEDIRLFAKTSGDTSLKMWLVARYRRTRPETHIINLKPHLI